MFDLLSGCKIIDLTTIILGPYATQTLGDMGADVTKVESPGGDLFRASPPSRSPGMGAGYLNCNRNKKSICIDLKKPEGRDILLSLLGDADVFVHNMRPNAAKRLGLSYEELKKVNPKLVYCLGPGYGQDGPYADYPAFDDVIQAISGVADLNANAEGEPRFLPTVACDKISGLHLAIAILGGLNKKHRDGTGCSIEVPMFESMLSFLYVEHLFNQSFRPPLGDHKVGYNRVMSPYRKPYQTKDGFIAVMPYTTSHWTAFLILAGRDDIATAQWVTDPEQRGHKIDTLYEIIDSTLKTKTCEEWLTLLGENDIPCAPVNSLQGLLDDPHLEEVGFFNKFNHPSEGEIMATRSPFVTTGVDQKDDLPAPQKGEHTREILRAAGLSTSEIDLLFENKTVV